jgi:hypothetical protein
MSRIGAWRQTRTGRRRQSRIVRHINAEREPDRAWRACDSHLARAKWMTGVGYRQLLRYNDGGEW